MTVVLCWFILPTSSGLGKFRLPRRPPSLYSTEYQPSSCYQQRYCLMCVRMATGGESTHFCRSECASLYIASASIANVFGLKDGSWFLTFIISRYVLPFCSMSDGSKEVNWMEKSFWVGLGRNQTGQIPFPL